MMRSLAEEFLGKDLLEGYQTKTLGNAETLLESFLCFSLFQSFLVTSDVISSVFESVRNKK